MSAKFEGRANAPEGGSSISNFEQVNMLWHRTWEGRKKYLLANEDATLLVEIVEGSV